MKREHVVPDEKNFLVAEQTVILLLWRVPRPLKGLGKQVVFRTLWMRG